MSDRETWGHELVAGLEELVLEVLREAEQNNEILGPTAIARGRGYISTRLPANTEIGLAQGY